MAAEHLHDGHDDFVCFFPGLTAEILRAVFDSEYWDRNEDVRRKIDFLGRENPYSGGREPWLPDSVARRYREYEGKDQKRLGAERRASGETLYRLGPDAEPVLIEHGLWNAQPRSVELLVDAEERLRAFGFEKRTEGQVVCWRRDVGNRVLYADPRLPGKITISAYELVPPKAKRGKPRWQVVLHATAIPDNWWRADTAEKFAEWLSRHGLT